jgi:hypothetical protein
MRPSHGDLSGHIYGRNIVLEPHHRDGQRHTIYLCRDLYDGSEHLVRDSELVPLEWALCAAARKRANHDGKRFSITEADIFIPPRCPILGMELRPSRGRPGDGSPTVDCIDNDAGYTPSNIWVISFRANMVKNAGTEEEHERIAEELRTIDLCGVGRN